MRTHEDAEQETVRYIVEKDNALLPSKINHLNMVKNVIVKRDDKNITHLPER